MKSQHKLLKIMKYLPMAAIIILAAGLLASGRRITAEEISGYSPSNPFLAALFLLLIYGLKSLSVFLPIAILNVAGGMLFPAPVAIFLNLLGCATAVTIPYWIGRLSSRELLERLTNKYPKVRYVMELQQKNKIFFSFFIRVIGVLPLDIVSMCMGASAIPYGQYILGTVLGMLPSTVAITLIGTSLTEPGSMNFKEACGGYLVIAAASLMIYRAFIKKRNKAASEV